MCRNSGWNDTNCGAKPADPPDSGIRNPGSSQRSLLVPRMTKALSARGVSVRRFLQVEWEFATLLFNNHFHFSNLLFCSFGHRVAPILQITRSLKFHLPECWAGENVEKICAVSARDSLDRDFTPCALAPGGGN